MGAEEKRRGETVGAGVLVQKIPAMIRLATPLLCSRLFLAVFCVGTLRGFLKRNRLLLFCDSDGCAK